MQHNEEENDEVLWNLIIKSLLGRDLESPHIFVWGIKSYNIYWNASEVT